VTRKTSVAPNSFRSYVGGGLRHPAATAASAGLGVVLGQRLNETGDPLAANRVSGVCTQLGCKLSLVAHTRQPNCPCHNAAFAVAGAVLHHRLRIALPPLAKLMVRKSEGQIERFVPLALPE
jgi:hypothetical protein